MKKTWKIPEIETLSLSTTSYDTLSGQKTDGPYLDHEDCTWKDAYYS